MHLSLGAKDGNDLLTVFAGQKARNSLTLFTTHRPLRPRNVEWLVFEEPPFEMLLSRSLLQSLSFDLDEHLKTVWDTIQDCDFSRMWDFCNHQEKLEQISSLLRRVWVERGKPLKALIILLPKQGNCPNYCWPLRFFRNRRGRLTLFHAVDLINGSCRIWAIRAMNRKLILRMARQWMWESTKLMRCHNIWKG